MITIEDIKLIMISHNVNEMHITFSGGGDDGDINSIFFIGKEDQIINLQNEIEKEKMDQINDICYNILYEELMEKDFDWVNNEGGYGTLIYKIEENEFEMDYSQNIVEEHNWTFKY